VKIINPMKRALIIATISLVAVIMGMSAVAPMIPPAYATHLDSHNGQVYKFCRGSLCIIFVDFNRDGVCDFQTEEVHRFVPTVPPGVPDCPAIKI